MTTKRETFLKNQGEFKRIMPSHENNNSVYQMTTDEN